MEAEEILQLRYMARRLRVPTKWLREQAEQGHLPCLKAGRQILFNPTATEKAIAERAATERCIPEAAHALAS